MPQELNAGLNPDELAKVMREKALANAETRRQASQIKQEKEQD